MENIGWALPPEPNSQPVPPEPGQERPLTLEAAQTPQGTRWRIVGDSEAVAEGLTIGSSLPHPVRVEFTRTDGPDTTRLDLVVEGSPKDIDRALQNLPLGSHYQLIGLVKQVCIVAAVAGVLVWLCAVAINSYQQNQPQPKQRSVFSQAQVQ